MKNWNNIDMSTEKFPSKMETIYKCKSCEKSFNQGEKLKKHILISHKVHECDFCGETFTRQTTLKNHTHTVHEGHKVQM